MPNLDGKIQSRRMAAKLSGLLKMVLGRNARPFLSSEARNYSEIYKLIDRKSPFLVVLRSYRTVDHILSCQLVEIRILRQNLGLETIWPDFYIVLFLDPGRLRATSAGRLTRVLARPYMYYIFATRGSVACAGAGHQRGAGQRPQSPATRKLQFGPQIHGILTYFLRRRR